MKDRIGNKFGTFGQVLVELPTSSIVGFIADLQEPGLVLRRNHVRLQGGFWCRV